MKIFYDGVNVSRYISRVDGVTTNTSYVSESGVTDYLCFMKEATSAALGKPISFQVTNPEIEIIRRQARIISKLGDNVYVKIPIILPCGSTTSSLIKELSNEGIKINVTCIHTQEQVREAFGSISDNCNSIISVFAGGISDSGSYPDSLMNLAVTLSRRRTSTKVLWAGCQRVLSVVEAEDMGCDIITVPDAILDKMKRMEFSQHDTSINKSILFFKDGESLELGE